ncbi:hypothetical protein, partial [Arthrobacter woluwensis]|uniref:hypothetical protein n=1 Tax=Arthrobacter woluwensis TaxID=156980 RepID=UPI001C62AE2E
LSKKKFKTQQTPIHHRGGEISDYQKTLVSKKHDTLLSSQTTDCSAILTGAIPPGFPAATLQS